MASSTVKATQLTEGDSFPLRRGCATTSGRLTARWSGGLRWSQNRSCARHRANHTPPRAFRPQCGLVVFEVFKGRATLAADRRCRRRGCPTCLGLASVQE